MSRLNTLEQEAQDVLVVVRDILTATTKGTGRESYMELMGRIRDVLRKLQNKEYGCATGTHSGPCQCKG